MIMWIGLYLLVGLLLGIAGVRYGDMDAGEATQVMFLWGPFAVVLVVIVPLLVIHAILAAFEKPRV